VSGAPDIVIVDYGMGNLTSVANALRFLGGAPLVSDDPARVREADAIILPGVGAFAQAMENLERRGLVPALSEQVRERGRPFLGICLGMQLLAESSTEMGPHRGLGWIRAHAVELQRDERLPVPHVGWNDVRAVASTPLFTHLPAATNFYFDHSYQLVCDDARDVAAVCAYGADLVAAVHRDNIFAVQFHPEKSQIKGLELLRNFLNYVEARRC